MTSPDYYTRVPGAPHELAAAPAPVPDSFLPQRSPGGHWPDIPAPLIGNPAGSAPEGDVGSAGHGRYYDGPLNIVAKDDPRTLGRLLRGLRRLDQPDDISFDAHGLTILSDGQPLPTLAAARQDPDAAHPYQLSPREREARQNATLRSAEAARREQALLAERRRRIWIGIGSAATATVITGIYTEHRFHWLDALGEALRHTF